MPGKPRKISKSAGRTRPFHEANRCVPDDRKTSCSIIGWRINEDDDSV